MDRHRGGWHVGTVGFVAYSRYARSGRYSAGRGGRRLWTEGFSILRRCRMSIGRLRKLETRTGAIQVIRRSDIFILLAVAISFVLSGFLWFTGNREEGVFTALWVPSILCFGIYFKLMGILGSKQ